VSEISLLGLLGSAPVGYALYLYNGRIGFQIAANGTWWNFIPANTGGAANGDWHHLAATIARGSTNVITLYVDGYFVNQWDASVVVAPFILVWP